MRGRLLSDQEAMLFRRLSVLAGGTGLAADARRLGCGSGKDAIDGPPWLHALWGLGLMATLQGDVASARPVVEEALRVARDGGVERGQALALNLLGLISIITQDPLAAMPLLEESLAIGRAAGDGPSIVAPLIGLGRAHLFLGEIGEARAAFEECLTLTPEKQFGGHDRTGSGGAGREEARAQQLFEEVLPLLSEAGDRFETALVLSFLGELA